MASRGSEAAKGAPGEALAALWAAPAEHGALEELLVRESRLPGPRGNLELAARFGDLCDAPSAAQWRLLERWRGEPGADAREFLPFCAVLGMGQAWREGRRRGRIEAALRSAASDPRWRVREAAAMALQRVGYADPPALRALLSRWLASANLLEQRAILAALADPPLLTQDPEAAGFALGCSEAILGRVEGLDAAARRGEEFRALAKGLGYALSVFVAQRPESGFELLARWATRGDAAIKRIVEQNLGKARLARHPGQVARIREALAMNGRTR